ncbi:MAG TPA: hypothetical protein VM677_26740 [Actinokineospora sp.]|jgi:hypothetical protein|nr:hypothetical protein [Actinokineospora sp.]
MEVRARRTLLLWLLLCAVAVGLVGMHHLGGPVPAVAAVVHAEHEPEPTQDHDQAHLCMAAVSGVAAAHAPAQPGVLVATPDAPAPTVRLTPASEPRPAGRSLLTSVCVLRL